MDIRNPFGVHTDVNGMHQGIISISALVKVLFHPSDAGIVRARKSWAHPNAYWVYRGPMDQDASTPLGELQTRYKLATTEESIRRVGQWYAEWHAGWMLPAGLEYMFVEGGPNEQDPGHTTTGAEREAEIRKAVLYSVSFVENAVRLGLKPAPGMYSFGKPAVPKWDGYDGWEPWIPVFQAIDTANVGHTTPQAAFQFHSYAEHRDMPGSIDSSIGRYALISQYKGPVILGELGWSADGKPFSTEEILRQIRVTNAALGADDRLMGYALWDCRAIAKDQDRFDYMYADMIRDYNAHGLPILPITVHTGSIIPVPPPPPPPDPDPSPTTKWVRIWQHGCNMRAATTSSSQWLGGANIGSEFEVNTTPTNGYYYVPRLECWIWGNNIKEIKEHERIFK